MLQEALPPHQLQVEQLAWDLHHKGVLPAFCRQEDLQAAVAIGRLTNKQINAGAHQPGSCKGGNTRSLLPG